MFPSPPDDNTCPPFMSQIAIFPLVSRQRMSPLPSPLKSAVPTTDQVVGTFPTPLDEDTCAPFMNQIAMLPLVLSRQSKSDLPSPLKSRCPTIDQGGIAPNTPDD